MVARGAAAPWAEVITAYCSSLLKIIAPEREKWWWWPSALGTMVGWLIMYDLKLHLHPTNTWGQRSLTSLWRTAETLLQLTAHSSCTILLQHHQLSKKTTSKSTFQITHAILWARLGPLQSKGACWALQKGVAYLVMSKGCLSHGGACTTSSQRQSLAWAKFT